MMLRVSWTPSTAAHHRERAGDSGAAEKRDEGAPLHCPVSPPAAVPQNGSRYSITLSAQAIGASLSRELGLATRAAASMLIFLYLGSAVTSAPIQSGSVNFWSASVSSISARTTPSKSPS